MSKISVLMRLFYHFTSVFVGIARTTSGIVVHMDPAVSKPPLKQILVRALGSGTGNGILLLCIVVWPVQRFGQADLSIIGGILALVWLGIGSALFVIVTHRFCAWIKLQTSWLTPVFTLLSYALFIYLLLPKLEPGANRLLVVCLSAVLLGIAVAFMNEILTRVTSHRIYNFIGLIFLGGIIILFVAGFNHQQKEQTENAWRQAVADLDFTIYLPEKYEIRDPFITTNTFSGDPLIIFQGQAHFSESKYAGQLPPEDCGKAFGKESDTVQYHCQQIHKANSYLLFKRREVYSNPNAVTPYNDHYFAIFNNQTIVWYGDDLQYDDATGEPVEDIIRFYDSLQPVGTASRQMKQLTEEPGVLRKD